MITQSHFTKSFHLHLLRYRKVSCYYYLSILIIHVFFPLAVLTLPTSNEFVNFDRERCFEFNQPLLRFFQRFNWVGTYVLWVFVVFKSIFLHGASNHPTNSSPRRKDVWRYIQSLRWWMHIQPCIVLLGLARRPWIYRIFRLK